MLASNAAQQSDNYKTLHGILFFALSPAYCILGDGPTAPPHPSPNEGLLCLSSTFRAGRPDSLYLGVPLGQSVKE